MTTPSRQGSANAEGELPLVARDGRDALGFSLPGDALLALPDTPEAPLAEAAEAPEAPLDPRLLELPATSEPVAQAAPAEPAPSAEQWLLSMLGQRQATVQARESEAAAATEAPLQLGVTAPLRPQPPLAAPGAPTEAPLQPAAQPAAEVARALPAGAPEAPTSVPLPASEATALQAASVPGAEASPLPVAAAEGGAPAPTPLRASDEAAPVLERQLRLQAPEAKWGEQMLGALRDSVELQLQQKAQSATIRLDPPELGSLEILLSHDSGRLNVQINAAQGDVARLLQQTSERLRQELVGQNFLQVSVQVGADAQSGQQGQQQARTRWQAEEALPGANPQDRQAATSSQAGASQGAGEGVLITV